MTKLRRRKTASKTRKKETARRTAKNTRLPKDAVTLLVVLRAKERQEALLEAELRVLIGPTRREEGCLGYDLHRGADQPGAYLLHEVWASREHHTRHTQTAHFLRWSVRKDALLASRESAFWKQIQ